MHVFSLNWLYCVVIHERRNSGGELQLQICWASNYHDSREEMGEIWLTIPFISCSKFNTRSPPPSSCPPPPPTQPSVITLFPPLSSPAFLPWQEEESFLSLAAPFKGKAVKTRLLSRRWLHKKKQHHTLDRWHTHIHKHKHTSNSVQRHTQKTHLHKLTYKNRNPGSVLKPANSYTVVNFILQF